MHDVSNAINILDTTKGVDKAICGSDKWLSSSNFKETAGKCYSGETAATSYTKLSDMFEGDSTGNKRSYPGDATSKMGDHTSATISKDTAALTRDQKGVVASAFAKAHEGA